jgi:hypothetical protein
MSSRGEYRAIHTVLIDGADYQALSPAAKLVLLTLKLQLGPSGIDVLYPAVLEEQTGLSHDQVMLALTTLEHTGWIQRERNVVWIVEGLKHDPHFNTKLPNHRKGLAGHIAGLPRLRIVARFIAAYPNHLPEDVAATAMVSEYHADTMAIPSTDHADATDMVSASGKGKGKGKRERDIPRRARDEGSRPSSGFDLAPYIDAHREAFPGSTPPAGRYGRVFKQLEASHGRDEVLRRFRICLAVKRTFGTPEELAAHWSEYGEAPAARSLVAELEALGADGWYADAVRPAGAA